MSEAVSYRLKSPGPSAYRVQLVEKGPSSALTGGATAEALLTGAGDERPVLLPPGDYWGSIDDIGSGERRTLSLSLDSNQAAIDLQEAFSQSVPRRRSSSSALSGAESIGAAAIGGTVKFVVGLSEDRAPGHVGGWGAAAADMQVAIKREGSSLRLQFGGPPSDRRSKYRVVIGLSDRRSIRVPLPRYRDGVEVVIALDATLPGRDLDIDVRALDPTVQALVAALSTSSRDESLTLVEWAGDGHVGNAVPFLAQKRQDLWAATAAALLLVRARRMAPFEQWFYNLAEFAPHIADSAIAAAWVTLATGTGPGADLEAKAMEYLRFSGRVGAPNFVAANSLGMELLNSLRTTAESDKVRAQAGEEYALMTKRSEHRLLGSPYMIYSDFRPQRMPSFWRFPSRRLPYRTLAAGTTSTDGVQFD